MENDDSFIVFAAGAAAFVLASRPSVQREQYQRQQKRNEKVKAELYAQMSSIEERYDIVSDMANQLSNPFKVLSFAGLVADYIYDNKISTRWWMKVQNTSDKVALFDCTMTRVDAFDSEQKPETVRYTRAFVFQPKETMWILAQKFNEEVVFGKHRVTEYLSATGKEKYGSVVTGTIYTEYLSGVQLVDSTASVPGVSGKFSINFEEVHESFLYGSILCVKSIKDDDTGKQTLKDNGLIK